MTAPLTYGALDQSTFLTDTEKWPQLPRQGGQDLHGPSQHPTARPRESAAGYPMASPTATQPQEQRLQETTMNSTEQVMISSEEVLDLTIIGRVQHERRAQLARNHPLGEGHEQARSEYKEKPDNTQTTTTGQYTHSTPHC